MHGEDRASARVQQERLLALAPSEREDGMVVWDPAGGDERNIAPGAAPADLVANTVEVLQARRSDCDRDALRGTIEPFPRHVRSQRELGRH